MPTSKVRIDSISSSKNSRRSGVLDAGGIDVEDAAAGAELAEAVDDGHPLEAGVEEVGDQAVEGLDLAAGQAQGGPLEDRGRDQGGEQGRRGGDDDRRDAGGQRRRGLDAQGGKTSTSGERPS